jgi:alpha-L-arabinofuranosidase
MYSGHQGGQALRVNFDVPFIQPDEGPKSNIIAKLSGSASIRGNTLTLTVANPHISQSHDARINIQGAKATSVAVSTLTGEEVHAQNTFDNPNNVVPKNSQLNINGSSFS